MVGRVTGFRRRLGDGQRFFIVFARRDIQLLCYTSKDGSSSLVSPAGERGRLVHPPGHEITHRSGPRGPLVLGLAHQLAPRLAE